MIKTIQANRLFLLLCLLFLGATFPAWSEQCSELIDQMKDYGTLKKALHCLDKKTKPVPTPKGFYKAEVRSASTVGEFKFAALNCIRSEKDVTCTVIATNKNKGSSYADFGIYASETSFDDELGNEHGAVKIAIGTTKVEVDDSSDKKVVLRKNMPFDTRKKILLTFANIPKEITTVYALNIKFYFHHNYGGRVTLKGIVIEP